MIGNLLDAKMNFNNFILLSFLLLTLNTFSMPSSLLSGKIKVSDSATRTTSTF